MKRRRATFRRRTNPSRNDHVFGIRAAFRDVLTRSERQHVSDGILAANTLWRRAPKPLPGETHRQLAVRLRAEAVEQPVAPKPRRKKASA